MNDKKTDIVVLALLCIPVLMATGGLVINFNIIDFGYLLLVLIVFTKFYIKVKN